MRRMTLACRAVGIAKQLSSRRSPAAGLVLIAWAVGLPLARSETAAPAEAAETPTAMLRVFDPDRSALRPASAEIRIRSSDEPKPAQATPAKTRRRASRVAGTEDSDGPRSQRIGDALAKMLLQAAAPTRLKLDLPAQAAEVPSAPATGVRLDRLSNSARTAARSATGVDPYNRLNTLRAEGGDRRLGRSPAGPYFFSAGDAELSPTTGSEVSLGSLPNPARAGARRATGVDPNNTFNTLRAEGEDRRLGRGTAESYFSAGRAELSPTTGSEVSLGSLPNPARTAARAASGVASHNTLRVDEADLELRRGAALPQLSVSGTELRVRLGPHTADTAGPTLDVPAQDAKVFRATAATVAESAGGVASYNTLRLSEAARSDQPELRQTVEHSPEVSKPRADDSGRSRQAVRVASYDVEPSKHQAKPERQAILIRPLLEVVGAGESSPAPTFLGRAPTPLSSEQTASLEAEPPRDEQPSAEQPAPEPPPANPPGAEPIAANVERLGPFEVMDHADELTVVLRRSKLLRTNVDVYRTAVVDAAVCDVVQFTPREVSIIGKGQGATHVTFWFEDGRHLPVTYLVRVAPDPEIQERREEQYDTLEEVLAELFPESKVKLTAVADKLVVQGQARDAAEAAQILAVIRGQAVIGRGVTEGPATDPLVREETKRQLPATQVVNMLQIPGVHQVALRVKIAELNRTAARNFGVDIDAAFAAGSGQLIVQSLLGQLTGGTASILGSFDNDEINFGIHYLEQHGVVRMLSEPTLVTLSGRPASFVAGGEFAVPTTVGVEGVGAVTTDFRAFGAIITFLPTVLDKDHIRLEVAPEFSQVDTDLANANGTPGLTTRAVTTTVEMREGQTLAIAGLLDDSMEGNNRGDLPLVARIFGRRDVTRNQTELIILVTPELVHPMEPEAVPPLPGFDVTEPTNGEFFLGGRIEGRPTHEYRSTLWPRLRRRYQAGGSAMISGPFGHGD